MSDQWQHQLRLYLADELAEVARRIQTIPPLGPCQKFWHSIKPP